MRSLLLCLLAACAQASFVTNTLLPRAQTSQRTAVSAITMAQPKGVVITGGAGGVGWAYADEFMRQGHWVVICDVKDPEPAVEALTALHPDGISRVHGITCDVSDAASVQKLVEFSQEKLGTIHYWINNAGINGGRRPFTSVPLGVVEAVVKVNLMGLLLCTHAAMTAMQQQKGVKSHIFQTVGSGVKGGGTPGYACYGATKRGLPQLTDSLVAELTKGVPGYDMPTTPGEVSVHTLSPGMVFTDLLLDDSTPELRKFPFGVLAAQPDEVAKDLVPKILGVSGNGQKVEFLTQDRILMSFYKRFIKGEKSEFIDDDGNVIKKPGGRYAENGVKLLF
jgi:chlorophyll(ide) b reductase